MLPSRNNLIAAALALCTLFAPAAWADVWESQRVWNDQHELEYSAWIQNSFDEHFFLDGAWAGIETDCADAVYASRIIFSYFRRLPFALSETDLKLSNASRDFDRIADPIQRVRAFIGYVNNRTWTGSLAKHTYLVAVDREAIRPGVIWLKPGHVETVRNVQDGGAVELLGSWLPAAIRKMITITQLGHVPRKPEHGFRRWIWPQNLTKPTESQPGFSSEQSTFVPPQSGSTKLSDLEAYYDVSMFERRVQARLQVKDELAGSRQARLVQDFCALIQSRSEVVNAGYAFAETAARCMTEKEYFAYSTPSRDSNLRRTVIGLGIEFENNLNQVRSLLSSCEPVTVGPGQTVAAYDVFRRLLTLNYSSNPHEKPTVRFGSMPPENVCVAN